MGAMDGRSSPSIHTESELINQWEGIEVGTRIGMAPWVRVVSLSFVRCSLQSADPRREKTYFEDTGEDGRRRAV
jgi:hypothetical protein